jgi:hypothetical protein
MTRKRLDAMTIPELHALQAEIMADPASREGVRPPAMYNAKAKKKLDAIGWAITLLLAEINKQRYPDYYTPGYSGRNSNRR